MGLLQPIIDTSLPQVNWSFTPIFSQFTPCTSGVWSNPILLQSVWRSQGPCHLGPQMILLVLVCCHVPSLTLAIQWSETSICRDGLDHGDCPGSLQEIHRKGHSSEAAAVSHAMGCALYESEGCAGSDCPALGVPFSKLAPKQTLAPDWWTTSGDPSRNTSWMGWIDPIDRYIDWYVFCRHCRYCRCI